MTMNIAQVENILSELSEVVKKHEAILEKSGEKFNVFNILGLRTNEVRTHSAFLAELLNPKGSHGQKELFLELFVQQIRIKNFDCKNATVEVEKHIGFISKDYNEGGYIDLIITDVNNHAIIIENKIYAPDQKNQLLRYYNYGKQKYNSNFKLLYLTLNGEEPSKDSLGSLSEVDYNNITYSETILIWLESCIAKLSDFPIIKETIKQYIVLIKQLTNQSISSDMKKEIKELLTNHPEFLKILPQINSEVEHIKSELINDLIIQLNKKINSTDDLLEYDGLKYKIIVASDSGGFQFCFYGYKSDKIFDFGTNSSQYLENIRSKLSKPFKTGGTPICWNPFKNYSTPLEKLQYHEIQNLLLEKVQNELITEMKEAIIEFKKTMNEA